VVGWKEQAVLVDVPALYGHMMQVGMAMPDAVTAQ